MNKLSLFYIICIIVVTIFAFIVISGVICYHFSLDAEHFISKVIKNKTDVEVKSGEFAVTPFASIKGNRVTFFSSQYQCTLQAQHLHFSYNHLLRSKKDFVLVLNNGVIQKDSASVKIPQLAFLNELLTKGNVTFNSFHAYVNHSQNRLKVRYFDCASKRFTIQGRGISEKGLVDYKLIISMNRALFEELFPAASSFLSFVPSQESFLQFQLYIKGPQDRPSIEIASKLFRFTLNETSAQPASRHL